MTNDNQNSAQDYLPIKQWEYSPDGFDTSLRCIVVERYTVYAEPVFERLYSPQIGASDFMTGYYTGYVQVPEILRNGNLPGYDQFMDHGITVYGGLTYGPDSNGWVGWDSNHAFGPDWNAQMAVNQTNRLAKQLLELAELWKEQGPDATLETDE